MCVCVCVCVCVCGERPPEAVKVEEAHSPPAAGHQQSPRGVVLWSLEASELEHPSLLRGAGEVGIPASAQDRWGRPSSVSSPGALSGGWSPPSLGGPFFTGSSDSNAHLSEKYPQRHSQPNRPAVRVWRPAA